uniref:Uncharacterized protein n=1 Tax=Arundo donax TaxID=35708 RepID=A0A0A8YQJ2_ARUDO
MVYYEQCNIHDQDIFMLLNSINAMSDGKDAN